MINNCVNQVEFDRYSKCFCLFSGKMKSKLSGRIHNNLLLIGNKTKHKVQGFKRPVTCLRYNRFSKGNKVEKAIDFVIWSHSNHQRLLDDSQLRDLRQDLLLYFYKHKDSFIKNYKRAVRKSKHFFTFKTFLIPRFRKKYQRLISDYLNTVHIPYSIQKEMREKNIVMSSRSEQLPYYYSVNPQPTEFNEIAERYHSNQNNYLDFDTMLEILAEKSFLEKSLSERERKIFGLRIDGYSHKEIGKELELTSQSIRIYSGRINRKIYDFLH